ncbi:MAG: helix-turn-helix domain-containing protein [Dehalococcoidia bacterium]|nr:helix-turn-helix domain-containing protein [Dehalococcoidia bacterium]
MRWPDWLPRPQGAGPDLAAREAAAERAERAAALGRRLRDGRVAAGLSLADVERDTRINRIYLDAIEDARFEEIPAPVYARGFVRSYARYLGMDAEEAVAAVPRDLPAPAGLEPMPGLRRTATPTLPAVNMPVVVAAGIVGVLVLAAVFIVPRLGGPSGLDLPDDATPAATGAASGTAETTATGTATGTPDVSATVPPFDDGAAPDFTGVPRAEAQRVLDEIGVTPLIVEAEDEAAAGTVFDQSPSPGATLQEGDVVTLFISSGG